MGNTRPKLLVVELWGLGDLIIATPFLQAAVKEFQITLLAKPYAEDLRMRFWPEVQVVPFTAPWIAFRRRRKYRLHKWPWKEVLGLRKLRSERFEVGLSVRWDPRDHFLLRALQVEKRFGFPRVCSQVLLTDPLQRPAPGTHQYEHWRTLAQALGLSLPAREELRVPPRQLGREVLVHTGAGQSIRVWPLDEYRRLVERLRQLNYEVQVACDPEQQGFWSAAGEPSAAVPRTVGQLIALIDRAAVLIGNDSGPGHLAALCGVPTFTLFGSQLPEWFAPLHPASKWLAGKPCKYKPCADFCRFPVPYCLWGLAQAEVAPAVEQFVATHLQPSFSAH